MRQEKNLPIITILLLAVNVCVYAYVEIMGSSYDTGFMLQLGASYEPYITGNHEYYRLVTHFFLHYGFEHLFNNMVSLLILGYSLESVMGKGRYVIVYFLSGILAGISSAVYTHLFIPPEEAAVSCGASGAVYGLMGALLVLLIKGGKEQGSTQIMRYIVFLGLSLYSGIQDKSIDNAAHVGGFLAGFLICLIMCRRERMEVKYES